MSRHDKRDQLSSSNQAVAGRRSLSRRARIGLLALVAALLALPAAAQAANTTFTVVNQRGVLQAGTRVMNVPDGPTAAWTNAYGQVTLNVTGGQHLYFARGYNYGVEGPAAAPEGSGQLYSVPGVPPASAQIVLPNANGEPADPGNSPEERWLVGKINQERAAAGRAPLYISLTLNEATDRYANYMNAVGQAGHFVFTNPTVRMLDSGWPIRSTSMVELVGQATSVSYFWNFHNGSASSRAIMLDPSSGSVGIGSINGYTSINFAPPCTEAADRCQMTGDTGDPNLPIDGDNGGGDHRTNLVFKRPTLHGKRIRAFLTTDRQAEGSLSVTATKRGKTKSLRVRGGQGSYSASGRLSPGSWRVCGRFDPEGNWTSDQACRKVRIR
jgi:uncharacterized protein YkwD